MDHQIQVVTTSLTHTAVVIQTTTWQEFPRVWRLMLDEVYAVLDARGIPRNGRNVMLYRDDVPTVEVGVEASEGFHPAGRVVPSVLPAGAAAMTVHRGPYDRLGDTH